MVIARSGRGKGQWLKAEVVNGKLVMSIGIDVLEFACQRYFDEERAQETQGAETEAEFVITDAEQLAKEIAHEMLREDEVGDHALGRLLDAMADAAVNGGSQAVTERAELSAEGTKP